MFIYKFLQYSANTLNILTIRYLQVMEIQLDEMPGKNYRIKLLIDNYAKGQVTKFSEMIGLSNYQKLARLFHKDERNNKYPEASLDIIEAISSNIEGVTADWLIYGDKGYSVNVIEDPSKNLVFEKITNYKPKAQDLLIPYFDVDFIAGNAFESIDNKTTVPNYFMDIPDFRGCTAFRAYSDSMEGLIKSGSILFGTKVETWFEHLEYGQIYGIVCSDGRKYLKYIKKYRENPIDYFLLESENKFYDEFEMPKKSIRSIWLIHGHLNKRV